MFTNPFELGFPVLIITSPSTSIDTSVTILAEIINKQLSLSTATIPTILIIKPYDKIRIKKESLLILSFFTTVSSELLILTELSISFKLLTSKSMKIIQKENASKKD